MKATEEKELILQLQDENSRDAAFTKLVNIYKEPLYWQIRRMVLNHDDADDILQNTFIKAWNGIAAFRGESKLSTWLYRIGTNETLNFLERQHHPLISLDDEESHVATTLQSDPHFDGDETQIQLQQAINQLPAKQRQVFTLKYYDEMKYEDMSQILDTSVGALKASYHHAVKKICDFFNHNN
ncbi:MAG: sigma-70 family RNA polymerase sigma factor [Bacteroidaceae bacterium]|nr:sigma-70 family RNA polymerase sigma factor [Bacteroidaceae bacterium]